VVAQRTENRVGDAVPPSDTASPSGADLRAGTQDGWDGRVDAYLEEVDRQLATSPATKTEPVKRAPPSDIPPPPDAPPRSAEPRAEPPPASMAISRYEELVSERLWETQPEPAPVWRRPLPRLVAGALLVLLAVLAMIAFFWRTGAPANMALRPPAKERAVDPLPVVQEAPTHTAPRAPQSAVPAAPAAPPRASVERTEPPAPSVVRTPTVTHTQAVGAAAVVPARERATSRPPKPAANCSEASTVLGLCGAESSRGNAR